VKGLIQPEHRYQPGKILCRWGDAGWGRAVQRGKYIDGHFDDELVDASVAFIRAWSPQPAPEWVSCIPSIRHPSLVPSFARRVADALGLPFFEVLRATEARPEQKSMENSIQQARNIDGSFVITASSIPCGPMLLIDDVVDSRWTLTIAAWLLRRNGCGEVWPFVLAQTTQSDESTH
jgi:ATP-dependent DNA helicase RecQ